MPTTKPARLAAVIALLIAASATAFSALFVAQNHWCDDSFISFRYARNLADGLGLVYNPGERVEGYSNFLWLMVYRLGLKPDRPATIALLAPLFLAAQVAFLTYPMTGMETTFFTALVTFAVLLYHHQRHHTLSGAAALGGVLLCLSLTRIDGLVLAAFLLLLLFAFSLVPLYKGRRLAELTGKWGRPKEALAIGRHLDTALHPDHVLAIEWAGIAPSAMRQPVLDTFGLTDRDIVRQDFRRSVYGRWITIDYLASRRPDVVAACMRLYPTPEIARQNLEPGGSCHYRFYADLADPEYGYDVHIFQVREDAFWPALVRGETAGNERAISNLPTSATSGTARRVVRYSMGSLHHGSERRTDYELGPIHHPKTRDGPRPTR